ncbi:TIGR03009 domain-containing protein [Anatilimnocola sp. NA78]|uniref:TIGR03009 domain-containing protein n=1 Tax=Anatilimnocola sp. NA78 TaxID=3415683 RepID=UPI003CE51606
MTRATRTLFVLFVSSVSAGQLAAQNYQPQLQGTNPAVAQANPPSRYAVQQQPAGQAQPQGQARPAQGSVYGPLPSQTGQAVANENNPAIGAQGQVMQAAGQQPIRQPGPGAAGQGIVVPGNPLGAPRAAAPASPLQPEWFPLDPKVQAWVDDVLRFWEERSDKIKTLECNFQKWEYDPSYMPNEAQRLQLAGKLHELPFRAYSAGTIKYASPDKGLFKVENLQSIQLGKPGEKHTYFTQPPENGEHWVCDGKRVYAFDSRSKQVIEQVLPPEMQGKALADGPLPFMFGARAETIKARYWIRPLQAENKGEYCLEAVPKSRQDAANFKMVQIVLDEKEYLPVRMQIFESAFSPQNPHRTAYMFDKRVVNAENPLPKLFDPLKLTPWHREFFEVKTPAGWKRIVQNPEGPPQPGPNVAGPGAAAGAPPAQATRPIVQPFQKK